jgi:hypothetical protein
MNRYIVLISALLFAAYKIFHFITYPWTEGFKNAIIFDGFIIMVLLSTALINKKWSYLVCSMLCSLYLLFYLSVPFIVHFYEHDPFKLFFVIKPTFLAIALYGIVKSLKRNKIKGNGTTVPSV